MLLLEALPVQYAKGRALLLVMSHGRMRFACRSAVSPGEHDYIHLGACSLAEAVVRRSRSTAFRSETQSHDLDLMLHNATLSCAHHAVTRGLSCASASGACRGVPAHVRSPNTKFLPNWHPAPEAAWGLALRATAARYDFPFEGTTPSPQVASIARVLSVPILVSKVPA